MSKQDVFGIIVRTFGLYLLVWGLWNIGSLGVEVLALIGALFNDEDLDLLTKLYYLLAGSGAMLLGFVFMAKADSIVNWTYRHHREPPSTNDQTS